MGIREDILNAKTALGIEFGSTRIKAVLVDSTNAPIASGSHEWENRLDNGIWTYTLEDIWGGLQDAYADMAADVKKQYDVELENIGAIGFSAMMHGYICLLYTSGTDAVLIGETLMRATDKKAMLENLKNGTTI